MTNVSVAPPVGRIGFIGLGRMGEPMAMNLVRAGIAVQVWNRSRPALERLKRAGAEVAEDAAAVLQGNAVVLLMLATEEALDQVLGHGSREFAGHVSGRLLLQMGTVAPASSARLARDVVAAGGRYVEAPVSGSRDVAERGALVGMLAGDPEDVASARTLLAPVCAETYVCGPVPAALRTKLAINLFLIAMVTGLVEAAHLARQLGVNEGIFRTVLNAGPMASAVGRAKLDKLARRDFAPHASIRDVRMNARLIREAARAVGAATPVLDRCETLLREADDLGAGGEDMIAVMRGIVRGKAA